MIQGALTFLGGSTLNFIKFHYKMNRYVVLCMPLAMLVLSWSFNVMDHHKTINGVR
jgi:hypothetical protein